MKGAVQRPEANEGGREEEEKGLRISRRRSKRLHGHENRTTAGCGENLTTAAAACLIDTHTPVLSARLRNGSKNRCFGEVKFIA